MLNCSECEDRHPQFNRRVLYEVERLYRERADTYVGVHVARPLEYGERCEAEFSVFGFIAVDRPSDRGTDVLLILTEARQPDRVLSAEETDCNPSGEHCEVRRMSSAAAICVACTVERLTRRTGGASRASNTG